LATGFFFDDRQLYYFCKPTHMSYEEAIQLHSNYQFLIGKKGKYFHHHISDIFVLPDGNEKVVLDKILNSTNLYPKESMQSYGAKEYAVVVAFEIEGNYIFEDLSLYLDREP
jgi:hypothetical protein